LGLAFSLLDQLAGGIDLTKIYIRGGLPDTR
jgi:hypothetical protein